jgi:hypothetical protein
MSASRRARNPTTSSGVSGGGLIMKPISIASFPVSSATNAAPPGCSVITPRTRMRWTRLVPGAARSKRLMDWTGIENGSAAPASSTSMPSKLGTMSWRRAIDRFH